MSKLTLFIGLALGLTISSGHAALEVLDNQALTEIAGQGGADISLELRLNHDANAAFNCGAGNKLEFCRIAVALNNRYADGSYIDSTGKVRNSSGVVIANVGQKQWLVFKGVQGTINVQKIGLDGADLQYVDDANIRVNKPVIQFSFDKFKPIVLKNVGFQSLAIETDTVANEGPSNTPGYLLKGSPTGSGGTGTGAFADGKYITAGFDQGREVGFTGLNIHGNLAIEGTLKVFGCDAGHPRC